jgi:hypothetical protein
VFKYAVEALFGVRREWRETHVQQPPIISPGRAVAAAVSGMMWYLTLAERDFRPGPAADSGGQESFQSGASPEESVLIRS